MSVVESRSPQNPADVVARVTTPGAAGVAAAVDAARAAQPGWARANAAERSAALAGAAEAVAAAAGE
ncbi:aldehyde dehydrogenase family protein, partial [Sphaerisporangium aureirubrum]